MPAASGKTWGTCQDQLGRSGLFASLHTTRRNHMHRLSLGDLPTEQLRRQLDGAITDWLRARSRDPESVARCERRILTVAHYLAERHDGIRRPLTIGRYRQLNLFED